MVRTEVLWLKAWKMTQKQLKVAVYTRKSTEYGLEQEFNSLDAQREAAEAYIKSQKSEGWVLVKQNYDDGGISGGTMERPALKQILQDVESGRVDIIVVYKVDRLTRSLSDFARIIERLDKAEASFVSVTQQFNTSSSMGRLTLNVLLSFAQFEREVTSERIRDKIEASRKRGMWMGGSIPLGYDNHDKKLFVNEEEAKTIRAIFNTYLEKGSASETMHTINHQGYRTKRQRGQRPGGLKFSHGHFYNILKNPIFIGKVRHNGKIFDGKHDAIIDMITWEKVQKLLEENRVNRKTGKNFSYPSLLSGLLYTADKERMTPSHSSKKGVRSRYYITKPSEVKREPSSYPAVQIEDAIRNKLINWLSDENEHQSPENSSCREWRLNIAEEIKNGVPHIQKAHIQSFVKKVVISKTNITLTVNRAFLLDDSQKVSEILLNLDMEVKLQKCTKHTKIIIPSGRQTIQKLDQKLITLIAKAHLWAKDLHSGKYSTMTELANKHGVNKADLGKQVRLTYLAPDIITAIMEGRQPPTLKATILRKISNLPTDWEEQRKLLHFI
jgi:site-specific DNA recombinase